mgnify:CR=1 FL=1
MGNDGGFISKRIEMIKYKKIKRRYVRKYDGSCDLTRNNLKNPCCFCKKGYIFNKMDLLKSMIDGELKSKPKFKHIKSLKDIRDINEKCILKSKQVEDNKITLQCPITFKEFNGNK